MATSLEYSEAVADTWSLKLEHLDQFGKALPVVAAPLTAAIHLPVEHASDMIEEVTQAVVQGNRIKLF
ncbi:hypothetical protein U5801_09835 [Lamprobacter modestohalophilus]|uniref:hypothetical protein n=1 Tax=Lamprobacter modestohalophilus TaxID=1064514 RepID=UPI002ADEEC8B|nr:hypothetical protein [Lamprobacter modestohalophilus]MEA1050106.1 hypothetical protein [Lamprobacter modestohalophilus]